VVYQPLNGEQSCHNPKKAPTFAETQHTTYRSLRSVHSFLHSQFCTLTFCPILQKLRFTRGQTLPYKCPFPLGHLHPHPIHSSLGLHDSASQMPSQSVQSFLHTHFRRSLYFTIPHQNCSIEYTVPLAHPSPQPKQHLDHLNYFCMAHDRQRLTNRQTVHR